MSLSGKDLLGGPPPTLLPEEPGVVLFERFDNRDNLVVHARAMITEGGAAELLSSRGCCR